MTSPVGDEVLLPCPFCGAQADLAVSLFGCETQERFYNAKCMGCLAEAETSAERTGAIAAWNRRAQQPSGGWRAAPEKADAAWELCREIARLTHSQDEDGRDPDCNDDYDTLNHLIGAARTICWPAAPSTGGSERPRTGVGKEALDFRWIRGDGWRADCPKCVASKFCCDEHYPSQYGPVTPAPPTHPTEEES